MKKIKKIYNPPRQHWVGDGFPVRSLFSYNDHGRDLSPFLLLDYAAPAEFGPASAPRGVGEHPHRGFETVTIVYEGEVSHRDSTGQGGTIGPGDIQWMTAAGGILHEEFHSEAFTRKGGRLHMVQLWVNLPAKDKMSSPGYQAILAADIPDVALPDNAGTLRVMAGNYEGHAGPARTFSPMNVWDLRLKAGKTVTLPAPGRWNTAIVVLQGTVEVNGEEVAREAQLVTFDRSGTEVRVEANNDAMLLFLSGEPLNEPIVGHGPFVMNTEQEILRAFTDFNSGRFGQMAR